MLDWDRIRIFHAVAAAGSFTKAADGLNLSQSAVSRQIGGLEEEVGAALFHRHARGLILTAQGEILLKTANEVAKRMASAEIALSEGRNSTSGLIRIETTIAMGTVWLTNHLPQFCERYPDIEVSLIISDTPVNLAMREADVAIRLQRPTQPDLVQRRLMNVHTHIYGSPEYLERNPAPQSLNHLDHHRLIAYGNFFRPPVSSLNWILEAGREDSDETSSRVPTITINNVYGMLCAAERGLGLASLPDYLGATNKRLQRVLPEVEGPTFTAYFVYPEELRASKRVSVFRDFLLEKVAEQPVW